MIQFSSNGSRVKQKKFYSRIVSELQFALILLCSWLKSFLIHFCFVFFCWKTENEKCLKPGKLL